MMFNKNLIKILDKQPYWNTEIENLFSISVVTKITKIPNKRRKNV